MLKAGEFIKKKEKKLHKIPFSPETKMQPVLFCFHCHDLLKALLKVTSKKKKNIYIYLYRVSVYRASSLHTRDTLDSFMAPSVTAKMPIMC